MRITRLILSGLHAQSAVTSKEDKYGSQLLRQKSWTKSEFCKLGVFMGCMMETQTPHLEMKVDFI
jgi:hypothetical protein